MNTVKFLKDHPALKHHKELHDICKPLQLLNINYFSHAHVDASQRMTALSSCPKFFELYFKNGYQNYDLHNYDNREAAEYIIWDNVIQKEQSKAMHEDFMALNYGHTFSIIINNKNSKDCFHFATELGNFRMNERYLQLVGNLKRFIRYFKDKIDNNKSIKAAYEKSIPLSEQRKFSTEEQRCHIDEFNAAIKTKRIYSINENHYLTEREIECLAWLSQGKTLEQTAIILNITTRTIKAHVESIKQKTGCINQFQLGVYYASLEK